MSNWLVIAYNSIISCIVWKRSVGANSHGHHLKKSAFIANQAVVKATNQSQNKTVSQNSHNEPHGSQLNGSGNVATNWIRTVAAVDALEAALVAGIGVQGAWRGQLEWNPFC